MHSSKILMPDVMCSLFNDSQNGNMLALHAKWVIVCEFPLFHDIIRHRKNEQLKIGQVVSKLGMVVSKCKLCPLSPGTSCDIVQFVEDVQYKVEYCLLLFTPTLPTMSGLHEKNLKFLFPCSTTHSNKRTLNFHPNWYCMWFYSLIVSIWNSHY